MSDWIKAFESLQLKRQPQGTPPPDVSHFYLHTRTHTHAHARTHAHTEREREREREREMTYSNKLVLNKSVQHPCSPSRMWALTS